MTLVFDRLKFHALRGYTWATGDPRAMLVQQATWTPDAGDAQVADILSAGANEVSASGYSRKALVDQVANIDDSNDRSVAYCDLINFGAISPADPYDAVVIFEHVTNNADSWLIAVYDVDPSVTDGSTALIVPSPTGLFQFS